MDIFNVVRRKARKRHECNACLWLFEADYRNLGATFTEYRAIAEAVASRGKIEVGEVYDQMTCVDGGDISIIREKPEIAEICRKYKLYCD
jgi:hypothetical protein